LNNAYYDVERFGIRFVASPRHADVLMVTGPVTKNMREALERTYHAVPNPKWVIAVGDCARDGGCFASSYAVVGGGLGSRSRRPPHSRLPSHSDGHAEEGCLLCSRGQTQAPRHLRIWQRLQLFQAGLIAGGIQVAIVIVVTPLAILFAQYRDNDASASARDPASSVITLLPLIYVMFAAGGL